ncbi:MAG: hypothetical protein ACRDRH_21630 [Pseudonocardia sp.]
MGQWLTRKQSVADRVPLPRPLSWALLTVACSLRPSADIEPQHPDDYFREVAQRRDDHWREVLRLLPDNSAADRRVGDAVLAPARRLAQRGPVRRGCVVPTGPPIVAALTR